MSDYLKIEEHSIAKWGKSVAAKQIAKFEKAFKLWELNPDVLPSKPVIRQRFAFLWG